MVYKYCLRLFSERVTVIWPLNIVIFLIAWTVTYLADNAHIVLLDLTGNTSEWPAILFVFPCTNFFVIISFHFSYFLFLFLCFSFFGFFLSLCFLIVFSSSSFRFLFFFFLSLLFRFSLSVVSVLGLVCLHYRAFVCGQCLRTGMSLLQSSCLWSMS